MPQPTPYDIQEIPYFPLSPGFEDWLVLLLLFIIVFGLVWSVFNRPFRFQSKKESIKVAMEELNEIIASQLSADVKIEQAVAIIRRLLSVMLNTDISHLSASELGNISLSSEQNFLRPLVAFIVKLEELRYAGRLDLKKAEDQLNKLKILLSDIACRYQSIKKKKKS